MSDSAPILTRTVSARIPTPEGEFQLCHYTNTHDHREHLALTLGEIAGAEALPVRVHSECFTGDVLGSLRCDCGEQLHQAMRIIAEAGRGMIIYLRQEGRGIGLAQKLRAYNLQDEGYDTVEANLLLGHQADERDYWAAGAILAEQRVRSINLLTNNPAKIEHLRALGVVVTDRTAVETAVHPENHGYLATKVKRMQHMLTVGEPPAALPLVAPRSTAQHSTVPRSTAPRPSVRTAAQEPFPAPVQAELDALGRRMAAHAQDNGSRPQRPFVTLTYAQSLDGSIAAGHAAPLLLSGAQSMQLTHALRAAHDAILVGIGTVLADDPALTARTAGGALVEGRQPQPVVLDSGLRLPMAARLLGHPRRPWVATPHADADPQRRAQLELRGVQLIETAADRRRVALEALLGALAQRGIESVMVEGGAQVIGAFLRQRLVDAVVVTLAPRFVGGLAAVGGVPALPLDALPHLAAPRYTQLGDDLLVWGAPQWQAQPAR